MQSIAKKYKYEKNSQSIALFLKIVYNIIRGVFCMIERREYLDKLIKWKDKDLIKVITGIRRCGKSTLFELFTNYLKDSGIDENHIISINLENPDNEFESYKDLYKFVKEKIIDKNNYYVFLDEVQNVEEFEKAVDGLYIHKNIDVYITGSNARWKNISKLY